MRRLAGSYLTYVVVGLLVGAAVAPVAVDVADEPEPTVAVVPLEGSIDGQSAADTIAMLREARQNDSIRALVLVVNSGGGTAPASEELYLQVRRTARQMPVVTAVDGVAASGAYYAAVPSDRTSPSRHRSSAASACCPRGRRRPNRTTSSARPGRTSSRATTSGSSSTGSNGSRKRS